MSEFFELISEVGAPIAGSLVMGFFIFTVIKQILEGVVDDIKTLTKFCESLENRARTMSNDCLLYTSPRQRDLSTSRIPS